MLHQPMQPAPIAPQVAAPQVPQGGVIGGAAGAPTGHFNGVVTHNGEKIQVVQGKAEYQGKTYIVSDDGKIVVDEHRQLVGVIENGVFKDATPEIIDQLHKEGAIEQ